jgi:transcriptional regulator with XRE-family HTH domain
MFSENLKNLRNKKNITQEKLSNDLFVTHQTISKWENGKSYPDLGMLIKLAKYFNITVDELVSVEEYETAKKHGNIKKDLLNSTLSILSILFLGASLLGIVMFSILYSLYPFYVPYLIWLLASLIVFGATVALTFLVFKKNTNLRTAIYKTFEITLLSVFCLSLFYLILRIYQSRSIDFQYNVDFFVTVISLIISCALFVILILVEHQKKNK